MGNTLLVTGGTGFIGRAVLERLRGDALPDRLLLATRRAGAAGRFEPLALDLTAPTLELPGTIDAVLHLAGEKRDETRMEAVNHQGAARLVEAAARAGARRFVHLSSVGVYGAGHRAGMIDEACPHAPKNAYERSKDAGERAVRARCQTLGLECVVLQPSNVVGLDPAATPPLLGFVRAIARGWYRHIGRGGDVWTNYVAVDDVASALVAALRHPSARGVYIVNTPAPLADVVGWIAAELGVAAPTRSIPRPVGALAARLSGLGRSVLRRELPFSQERYQEMTNRTRFDGAAIGRTLGFDYPCGIERAIRAIVRDHLRAGRV